MAEILTTCGHALEAAQAVLVEARVGEIAPEDLPVRLEEALAPLADGGEGWRRLHAGLVAGARSLAGAGDNEDRLWEQLFQAMNRMVLGLEELGEAGEPEVTELLQECGDLLTEMTDGAAGGEERGELPGSPELILEAASESSLDSFAGEGHDLAEEIEKAALSLARDPRALRRILRALHTFKGNAGLLGLGDLSRLCHRAEELVQGIRDGRLAFDEVRLEELLLAFHDHCLQVVRAIEERRVPAGCSEELEAELSRWLSEAGAGEAGAGGPRPPEAPVRRGLGALEDEVGESVVRDRVTTRIEVRKLDQLFEWMDELIISRMRLVDRVSRLRARLQAERPKHGTGNDLEEDLERLEQAVEESARAQSVLEDQLMSLRLVRVGAVFQRIPRLVKQTARLLGKQVDVFLEGEDVELDKAVAESMADPLLHLVRNAVDHGIEPEEARLAAGKPARGRVRIAARYSGDRVVVEVVDDGRGIDVAHLSRCAVDRGVVSEEDLARMDERSRMMLIFRPGFSTAEEVSNISGRGIGMDVVRQRIEALKGSLEVESVPGRGTRIQLFVPLTMALVDILLVEVAEAVLALPLYLIRETSRTPRAKLSRLGECWVVPVHGAFVPVIWLGEVLGLDVHDGAEVLHLVVVEVMGRSVALVVGRIVRRLEAVLKPLEGALARAPFVSGTTILGDGRVVPILDPVPILRVAESGGAGLGASRGAEAGGSRARRRVLLVEDSRSMRSHLERLLQDGGYLVTAVENGAEALRAAREGSFDLVSTDIEMPVMDGYEFCRQLREDPRFDRLPVIALTSRGEKLDRIRGFEAGFDEYMLKPVDSTTYLACVRRLLERDFPAEGGARS